MTRTTAAVLALGSALTLAACSGSSSTAKSAGGTTPTPTATAPAGSTTPSTSASSTPSTSPSVPPATGSTGPSVAATGTAAATTPATTIPATVTSPGSKPTSTTATSTTASSTRCTNGELTVTLGQPDRGAGQIYSQIVFHNSGTTTCTLVGHPGVSYVAGDDGHQVGASATRTGSAATVTLKPGDAASALLHETNYANFDQATCKPVTVRGLRVYPPGSTAAVFLPRVSTQCSATSLPDPALSIAAVIAGLGS